MKIPIISALSNFLDRRSDIVSFQNIFGFAHTKLSCPDYQREALFKLGLRADDVVHWAVQYKNDSICKHEYDKAFHKYERAFSLIRTFAPEFGARIPHWSLLPNQLDPLIQGLELSLPEGESSAVEELTEHARTPASLFS